ncbi:MAG TPA: PepSY1/2 domain-containing protein [Symbiobacteriaceae bacterium]|jgi:spore germination protein|nr:PepSY1/2 domain-containing protein [Symbiobacteriaceae bacterium]
MIKAQRGAVWPYLVLSVALLGAMSFGAYQTRQANRLARDNENKYMSAFHKLKWTSENIEERTARMMATNDRTMQQSLLADLRVYSAQAVEHMAVLPLMTTNMPRIENFLNTLREQSDLMHEKLVRGGTLTDEDWSRLMEMRKQSVFFEGELSNLLGIVGNGVVRWSDTARATRTTAMGDTATPITKSMASIEKSLTPPPGEEKALAPETSGPLPRPKVSPGPPVDQATAMAAVRKFVDMPLAADPVVTGVSDPQDKLHEFSMYFLDAKKQNGLSFNFGVSVHGGHVVYMIDGRPVTEKRFTVEQLIARARDMLAHRGYTSLEYVSAVENDGTLVMDFAPKEKGVFIHVDRIKIMLAMDNGELLGFDSRNYWLNRHARQFEQPKLTAAQAVQRIAPRMKPEGQPALVLIADRRSKERLSWEVRGTAADQRFRVYIDAMTGDEIDVQRVEGDPATPYNEGQGGGGGRAPAAPAPAKAPAPAAPAR